MNAELREFFEHPPENALDDLALIVSTQ